MPEPLGASDPRKLGPYTLTKRLGEGDLGIVYHGRDRSGTAVAIKLLKSDLEYEPETRQRFNAAVETAAQVRSKYVAGVIESDIPSDRPYIVTQLVDGPSLFEVVPDQGPFHGEVLDRIAVGTAQGLVAIHAAGLTHQDLKPSNVLLGPAGPCVVDHAIASALHSAGAIPGKTSPAFQAPEQFAAYMTGASVGPAADVFSWASTMVYAATGRGPFGTDAPRMMLINLITEGEPDLTEVPERLRDLVVECLRKSPQERPSMSEVLQGLPHLSDLEPPAPAPDPAGGPSAIASSAAATPFVPDEPPPWETPPWETPPRETPPWETASPEPTFHSPDPYQPAEQPPPPPTEPPPTEPPPTGPTPMGPDPVAPASTEPVDVPAAGPGAPASGDADPFVTDQPGWPQPDNAPWNTARPTDPSAPPAGPGAAFPPGGAGTEPPASAGPGLPGAAAVPPGGPAGGPAGPAWAPSDADLDLEEDSGRRRKLLLVGLAVVLIAVVAVGAVFLAGQLGGGSPSAEEQQNGGGGGTGEQSDEGPEQKKGDDPTPTADKSPPVTMPPQPGEAGRPAKDTKLPGAGKTTIMSTLNGGVTLTGYEAGNTVRVWNPFNDAYEKSDMKAPRVSPDGRWIAGVVADSGKVVIQDRSNGKRRTIDPSDLPTSSGGSNNGGSNNGGSIDKGSNSGSNVQASAPRWAPDASKFLVRITEGGSPTGVVVIEARSLETRFVPIPDAQSVIFNAEGTGFLANPTDNGRRPDLLFYDGQGKETGTIPNAGWLSDDGYGTFSPDGTRIVTYCSKNAKKPQACVYDAKTHDPKKTVPLATSQKAPADSYVLGWYDNNRLLAAIDLVTSKKKLGPGVAAIKPSGDPSRFLLHNRDDITPRFAPAPA